MKMLELILLTSLTSLGLFISGYGEYVLSPIRNFLGKALGGQQLRDEIWYFHFENGMSKLWKPFWGCPTCMSSVWGAVVYTLFIPYSIASIYELPILILSSACINFVIFKNLIKKWLID